MSIGHVYIYIQPVHVGVILRSMYLAGKLFQTYYLRVFILLPLI